MKKYYKIENKIDTDEVGRNISSQTDGLVGKITFNINHSYRIFSHHNLPEQFIPNETIKLANSAKQTDFISTGLISGYGFIISERVKNVLEQFKLVQHKFYRIPLVHKQKKLDGYYWLHMHQPQQEYVDFDNSTFQVRKFSQVIKDELKLKSIDEYWEERKNYKRGQLFRIKQLKIKDNNYDFLYIGVGGVMKLISEELRDKLIEMKITGFKTSELNLNE